MNGIKLVKTAGYVAMSLLVIGFIVSLVIPDKKEEPEPPLEESPTVDSIRTVIDTVYIDKIKTRTKYKTIIQYETIYINNTSDSLQPLVRSNLRDSINGYLQTR